ncbi:hypothetical protein [Henriciella marina]|uniref:hypothetical protein n=1 Tax=Henriciella marina TaxID=453851 RepID=UPI0003824B9B|nr:hypothetical protein [Henriciella marina]
MSAAADWSGPSEGYAARADACRLAPEHACVLALLWENEPRIEKSDMASFRAAFMRTAILTRDEELIERWKEITGLNSEFAINAFRVRTAARWEDRRALLDYRDRIERGYDPGMFDREALASGLAAVGAIEFARDMAATIPNDEGTPETVRRLHEQAMENIALNSRELISPRDWALAESGKDSWPTDAFRQIRQSEIELRASLRSSIYSERLRSRALERLEKEFGADGTQYLRAVIYLAPTLAQMDDRFFERLMEVRVDPEDDEVARYLLMVGANLRGREQKAFLKAFDKAREELPPGLSQIRGRIHMPREPVPAIERVLFGYSAGSDAASEAQLALATLDEEALLAKIRAPDTDFSEDWSDVVAALLRTEKSSPLAQKIAEAAMEGARISGTGSAAYAVAETVARWAVDHCQRDVFDQAANLSFSRDTSAYEMWNARFTGDPASVALKIAENPDARRSSVERALIAYEVIVLRGYCKATES